MSTLNREITVRGEFKRAVIINDTLVNGENCLYDQDESSYSHAEGYCSKAHGMYSHADGVSATASHNYSFVWSGVNPSITYTPTPSSNGTGTFSIYTSGFSEDRNSSYVNGVQETFINGIKLSDILADYRNSAISMIRTTDNSFTGSLELTGSNKRFDIGSSVTTNVLGNATFSNSVTLNGESKAVTKPIETNDNTIATCNFVHKVVQEYFKNILGSGVITVNA